MKKKVKLLGALLVELVGAVEAEPVGAVETEPVGALSEASGLRCIKAWDIQFCVKNMI